MLRIANRPPPTETGRPTRRWHLAPVITHGPEALEGARILDEAPGELGLLLWQLLRDVTLWADTPVAQRHLLFRVGADDRLQKQLRGIRAAPALERHIQRLISIAADPAGASGEMVAEACAGVVRWGEATDRAALALDFSQAAALSNPEHAPAALAVARLAIHRGEHARAETWLRRAVTVGRRVTDWSSYNLALLELGRLYLHRQNRQVARRFLVRALRSATRHGDATTRKAAVRHLQGLTRTVNAGKRYA
jgi:tetratricopeptide (TPR) repeat protein